MRPVRPRPAVSVLDVIAHESTGECKSNRINGRVKIELNNPLCHCALVRKNATPDASQRSAEPAPEFFSHKGTKAQRNTTPQKIIIKWNLN